MRSARLYVCPVAGWGLGDAARRVWLALPLLALACGDAPRSDGSSPEAVTAVDSAEERVVPPASGRDSVAVDQIVEIRGYIDRQVADGRGLTLRLAALTADSQLVAVADTNAWPQGTVVSYGVRLDRRRRVVSAYEIPSTGTRDWFNEYVHYFDNMGRTILFERYSSFLSGCAGRGARETSTSYFAPGPRLLHRAYALKALDDVTRLDPRTCRFRYRHPYRSYATWRAFADSTGITRLGLDRPPARPRRRRG